MMQVIVGDVGGGGLNWEAMSIEEVLSLVTTSSLLGEVNSYKLDGALSGERAEAFIENADVFVSSPHTCIFFEEKLLKKTTDKLAKVGAKIIERTKKAKPAHEAFNVFSLTYAFASRDRKKLWLLYRSALLQGVVPEAIAGILHWKVRDMLSKREAGKYSARELQEFSGELTTLYHDSHRGAGDLALLLERFILAI